MINVAGNAGEQPAEIGLMFAEKVPTLVMSRWGFFIACRELAVLSRAETLESHHLPISHQ
jgi:hypothetical protein